MFKPHLRRTTRRPLFNKSPLQNPSPAQVRAGRCAVLVDARFLSWLTQGHDDRPGNYAAAPGSGVLAMLAVSLRQAGLDVDLLRTYWYTDQAQFQPVDDVVQRSVLDPDADGGMSLMRAMGADLAQLAINHAVDHVLVVSDDERLLPTVDQAQLQGLCVHLLVDEAGNDFDKLMREDPSWGRLLAQADRRVLMVNSPSLPGLSTLAGDAQHAADLQVHINNELRAWWEEEPEAQRLDLINELQSSSGIPQEVDRQLLLRLSRALGHPLSWPEKKLMRAGIRTLVLSSYLAPEPLPT